MTEIPTYDEATFSLELSDAGEVWLYLTSGEMPEEVLLPGDIAANEWVPCVSYSDDWDWLTVHAVNADLVLEVLESNWDGVEEPENIRCRVGVVQWKLGFDGSGSRLRRPDPTSDGFDGVRLIAR